MLVSTTNMHNGVYVHYTTQHNPPTYLSIRQVVCLGALSSSLVAVGSCNGDLTESILQIMMERDPTDLAKTSVRYLTLALALLYLGKQEAVEATMAALKVVPEPLCSFATTLLETCAYAGECVRDMCLCW